MAEPRIRQAVRALVLDPEDRVYLVHMRIRDVNFWGPPGGGIDPGETLHQALHRELHEEVGNADFAIGPLIWTSTRMWRPGWHPDYDGQTNTIFLVRVASPDLGSSLLSEAELRDEGVLERCWWTLHELENTATEFSPTLLPQHVAELLDSGPPTVPIDVGF